ncbi:amidohydrolase family protein [Thalassotalea profundi]|uniref:amidohydrolase family protein n=1 Tax=Thalassotalea profundi TaxID=2036687 RepID=UPI00167B05CE|nr:amidohydrolase family protein [Thalassotalea profundi]
MKIIDSHVHFFDLTQGDYHWLNADNPPFWPDKKIISKNFNESDLSLQRPLTIAGFVHIEAGYNNVAPWKEIEWLEKSCQLPFRSIAAIDLTLPCDEFHQLINKLVTFTSVVGCRHILDEQALQLLSSEQVQQNFVTLNQYQLNFEVQMPFADEKAVNKLSHIIANNTDVTFIINHAGMPPTDDCMHSYHSSWYASLSRISAFKNVAIKCSGWEMFDRRYDKLWLADIINQCITLFDVHRVMISSNFPLTLFSCSYKNYWETIIATLSQNQQDLLHNNSKYWYKIP